MVSSNNNNFCYYCCLFPEFEITVSHWSFPVLVFDQTKSDMLRQIYYTCVSNEEAIDGLQ